MNTSINTTLNILTLLFHAMAAGIMLYAIQVYQGVYQYIPIVHATINSPMTAHYYSMFFAMPSVMLLMLGQYTKYITSQISRA